MKTWISNPLKWTTREWLKRLPLILLAWFVFATIYNHTLGTRAPVFWLVRNKLQSFEIPADWELISTSEERGRFGIFCPFIGGGECPFYRETYKVSVSTVGKPEDYMSAFSQQNQYSNVVDSTTNGCDDIGAQTTCRITTTSGRYELDLSVSFYDDSHYKLSIRSSKNTRD
ncbi:MAG: hypothetical protein AAF413_00230 [Patescibacteria group bacterium]